MQINNNKSEIPASHALHHGPGWMLIPSLVHLLFLSIDKEKVKITKGIKRSD